ncbi:hypothetical protein DITRI_Ditri17bG0133900 [Diplodiscus trichospermus]
MNDSNISSSSSSSSDSASVTTVDQNADRSQSIIYGGQMFSPELRHWRDVFWLAIFIIHLIVVGFFLPTIGLLWFKTSDVPSMLLTVNYLPTYAIAGGVGAVLGGIWLLLLGSRANQMMKVSVHILSTYLAVISVLCFWCKQTFWGVAFAIGAALQFLYVISVMDRLPFTMLVLQKAVKMVSSLPEVTRVAYAFMAVMLLWMGIWSFGAFGVLVFHSVEFGLFLHVFLSISLFWTGAVLCNTVHVIVSGLVFLVLIHGGRNASSMPRNSLMKSLRYAVTTSFGSICYGSLFTAAIRIQRWEIRGFRSKIGNNECLLCCVDFLFQLVETLVRFFNKYAYVRIAVYGKGFNLSSRDAWELFQSTGVEALVAYDCSGAVLLMGTLLGGLITGTSAGVWTWNTSSRDRVIMVGSTAMLMGMILVGLAMVVVESAVTSIYICYAEDPSFIQRWDPQFYNQMSETLHQRLQHRSARAREVLSHNQLESHMQNTFHL